VVSLKDYIVHQNRARRISRPARRPMREDVGDVGVMSSLSLGATSVALPAGIDLEDRAARMNEFWRALAQYQHRDVLVIALCADQEN